MSKQQLQIGDAQPLVNRESKGLIDECIATADAVLKRQRAESPEQHSDPLTTDKSLYHK